MKLFLFYLKFFLIGLINSFVIIILAGMISMLFGVKHIIFFMKFTQEYNIPFFITKIILITYDFIIMSIATIPILIITYLLIHSSIKEKWKSISIITSLSIFLFGYLAPYYTSGTIYYGLFELTVVIFLNIYIIFKLSKRQLST